MFLFHEIKGQENLITNPSFEEIDSCYGNVAPLGFDVFEWSGCDGWSNPIYSSSDLWCENGIPPGFNPPNTPAGYQHSRTGENFAGILIGDAGGLYNYREYIQNQLSKPLTKNKSYEIVFYVSSIAGSCNISEIGIKFFGSKYVNKLALDLTNLTADVSNDVFITDTIGWQKISLNYIAKGNEHYAVIGCFVDSTLLKSDYSCDTTGWIGQIFPRDYIFLDDFSIVETESFFSLPNIITPNGDGLNDEFNYEIINLNNWKITFFNRWGNMIIELNKDNPSYDFKELTEGVYYYFLEADELASKQQGFLTIIK